MHITIDGRETAAILHDILTYLERLTHQGDTLMTLAQSTQDLLAALRARVAGLATEVASGTAGVREDIAALKALIGSSTPPDPTEIDAALQNILDGLTPLQTAADGLAALDAENPVAAPAPTGGSEGGPVDTGA